MSTPEDHKDKPGAEEEQMFYMENGLVVFTAAFHLKRGYCCESGCRHCPYGFRKDRQSEKDRRPD